MEPAQRSIPPVTVEWVAGDGDARRATISAFQHPRAWLRVSVGSLIAAAVVAAIVASAGSGWVIAAIVFVGMFVAYVVLLQLISLAQVYRLNRRICVPGSHWASGTDDGVLRFDCPDRTLVLDRDAVRSTRRSGTVVVFRMRTGDAIAVPAALLPDATHQRRISA
ncbi:hypothetical protein [Mycobacterium sp. DL440]|uniref:hypothetical protein n=1 Tax=Mycobacterium sp. DL440 TaxID=2675523 RepID=UPI0014212A03|nr:hypothetical protein [Mycobacterium sp. DL440]